MDVRFEQSEVFNVQVWSYLGYISQYSKKCNAGFQEMKNMFQKKGLSYIKNKTGWGFFP